jgi:hypothetical protein
MPAYFPSTFRPPQTNSRTRFVDQISYSILRRPCGEEVFSRSASAARSAPGAQLRVNWPTAITAKIEERPFFVGRAVRAPALARHGELGVRAQLAFRILGPSPSNPLPPPCGNCARITHDRTRHPLETRPVADRPLGRESASRASGV